MVRRYLMGILWGIVGTALKHAWQGFIEKFLLSTLNQLKADENLLGTLSYLTITWAL